MKLNLVTRFLEDYVPLAYQEEYDNSGLIIGDPGMELTGAMVSLDLTPEVLTEAKERKCNLVISHHPLIFRPLKRITPSLSSYPVIREALAADIAVYAIHTNLDNSPAGINGLICRNLGLAGTRILRPSQGVLLKLVTFVPHDHAEKVRSALFEAGAGHIGNYDSCSYNIQGEGTFRALKGADPFVGQVGTIHTEPETRVEVILPAHLKALIVEALLKAHPYEEVAYDVYPLSNEFTGAGAGMTGVLPAPMTAPSFLELLKEIFRIPVIRWSGDPGHAISKVAVCSGAGSFLVPDAIRAGADALVTGDVKYHDFQEAGTRILLADAGHFETEHGVKDLISGILIEKFPNFAVFISEREKNPVHYF